MQDTQKRFSPQPVRHVGQCHSQEGFTLIEVLVAITIFAISFLGLAAGATSVMKANQISYFNTVAINLAQDQMEQLKAMSTLPTCPTYTTAGCSDSQTASGATFNRSWEITPTSPTPGVNFDVINVQIAWTDYDNRSLVISSVRH
jgi:type IV pilus modification protein PilV